ncbi:hypothetical protein AB6813_01525 [bacterium RCC_150]
MDVKIWLDFSLGILQAVAWPAILASFLVLFRQQIRRLLENVESAKVAGVETTFFRTELENPQNSDEVKDAVAQLWLKVASFRGEPVPLPASEQLSSSKRKRGQIASKEVHDFVGQGQYRDRVKQAIERIAEGRIKFTGVGPVIDFEQEGGLRFSDFQLSPEHYFGNVVVFARTDLAEVQRWSKLEKLGHIRDGIEMLVITPHDFQTPIFRTARWVSEGDDEALADVLEELGLFNYVEPETT